ncbi:MAG: methyltransferase, partial [Gammaproteobacteria bacterium]|nr:methyltransferase [Gammaproteobacteria bacterium]
LGHAQTLARMKTDYLYPELADRRSINEWEQSGSGDDLRDAVRDRVRAILSEHYPGHITADVDAWIRKNYNIVLPSERMRPGNGAW